ncbi:glycosyltransferase family 32 protein [Dysgonomonas sp. ZJ709]|uniref:glycosyltransferase family 32 protein n=1 Tax=Dysgonomonas sp. ZJ709 TaxID=2709797 RepID=UPI0013EAA6AE|nr:glycosyltransferase [Dysgonomonas sp. ZJ709]
MIIYNKETPILLVTVGSIENIQQIYNELQKIKPQRLYLVYNTPGTEEQVTEENQIKSIFNEIQWDCKVKILLNKKHLEYNEIMLKAVRWFFRHETEGIIFDGFSVPYPAFYAFCSYILEKYRYDERIGHISGWDFHNSNGKMRTSDSYYFSKLVHICSGWGSWRRVWQDIDTQLKTFPVFKKLNIIEKIPSHSPFSFQWYYLDHIDKYWESSYEYANLIENRLSIVSNTSQIPVNEYKFPEIKCPVFMINAVEEELLLQEVKYSIPAITPHEQDGTAFMEEKLLSYSKEAANRMKIPRMIHHIYEDPAGPPKNLLVIANTWKEKHPDWEYRFWNRQMIHDFLESKCPDFLEYYYSYPFNVQRWDAIRYLILYYIGGLYVDLDYECIQSLDVLLTDSSCCMGMEPPVHKNSINLLPIGNALMASVPKHPYMAAIIDDMKTNFFVDYQQGDTHQILATTGPLMVARVYDQYKAKKNVTLLPADLISPLSMQEVLMLRSGHARPCVLKKVENAFAIHYCFGSWRSQTAEGKAWQKNN